jgi:hypothetical protein
MNNYLALCEILYYWIMGDNGDRNLSFKIVHPEKQKLLDSFVNK